MSDEGIILGSEFISYHSIKEGRVNSSNTYFQGIIEFCRQWLNEAENFEIQTSGSTGVPKRIFLKRGQMILSAEATEKALGLKRARKALLCINANYIGGRMMLVRAMHLGLKLRVLEPDSEPLSNLGPDDLPDFTAMVPLQLEGSLKNSRDKLESIAVVIIGGAAVSSELLRQCSALPNLVYQTYGMTETCSHFAIRLISTIKSERYYTCLPGYEIRLDERECLAVRGPVTEMQWLQTNDIAVIYEGSSFEIKGRIDNVINSGGVKLSAEQLESKLAEKISGYAFFFAGLPDERLGEKLVLIVEGQMNREDLIEAMKDFGNYEKPREIYFLENFEYTTNGKLDRKASLVKLQTNRK